MRYKTLILNPRGYHKVIQNANSMKQSLESRAPEASIFPSIFQISNPARSGCSQACVADGASRRYNTSSACTSIAPPVDGYRRSATCDPSLTSSLVVPRSQASSPTNEEVDSRRTAVAGGYSSTWYSLLHKKRASWPTFSYRPQTPKYLC